MIKTNNISFYRDKKEIFSNYSLDINKGDCLAILGINGVGKSTFLNNLIGILKPTKGNIQREGAIGYVPQMFNMPFTYEVLDIVLMGRARNIGMFGSPKRKDYDIARENMSLMGILHLQERSFNNLSGGQRQLVMIAQALSSECDIMILDEPCAALDYKNQSMVLSCLKHLNNDLGMTIIYVTHTPQHALNISTHTLLMQGSDKYMYGTTKEVLTPEKLTKLYNIEIQRAFFDDANCDDDNSKIYTMQPRFDKNLKFKPSR